MSLGMELEKKWYVIHTYSGYENKVKTDLEKTVKNRELEDYFFDIVVPMEEQIEIKDGIDGVIEEIRSIAYSNNRLANYIEGRTLFKFDELNVMPKSSLYKDLNDAINNNERKEFGKSDD